MPKKFQIFVSSTYSDLVEERQNIIKAILDLGNIPSGMELFPAADEDQFEYIKKVIDECDYYVLVIGGRYGSTAPDGLSYTEKEYDYAFENGKPVLAFVHEDIAELPARHVDLDPQKAANLRAFIAKVSGRRLVKFWRTRDQLDAIVSRSLAKAFTDVPAIGWVRASAVASEDLLVQLNTLRDELDRIRAENASLRANHEPAVQNLAPLTTKFLIRFSYTEFRRTTKEYLDHDSQVEVSWAEIFKAIGPSYIRPGSEEIIQGAIQTFMREQLGITLRVKRIFDTDVKTIKIQLAAHGYLDAHQAQAVGGGVQEFIELTTLGRRALMDLMTIRESALVAIQ